jgi:hypothetical protein
MVGYSVIAVWIYQWSMEWMIEHFGLKIGTHDRALHHHWPKKVKDWNPRPCNTPPLMTPEKTKIRTHDHALHHHWHRPGRVSGIICLLVVLLLWVSLDCWWCHQVSPWRYDWRGSSVSMCASCLGPKPLGVWRAALPSISCRKPSTDQRRLRGRVSSPGRHFRCRGQGRPVGPQYSDAACSQTVMGWGVTWFRGARLAYQTGGRLENVLARGHKSADPTRRRSRYPTG